ncbi:ABC transporter permease [Streptomyces sp. M19]
MTAVIGTGAGSRPHHRFVPRPGGHRHPAAARAAPRPDHDPGVGAGARADREQHGHPAEGHVRDGPGPRADRARHERERVDRALFGVAFDDTIGALTVWRVGTFLAAFAAIMSLLLVVRHTREEEESGRQEALSAGMVGRRAGLTSALVVAGVANAAVALLIAASMANQGGRGAVALGLTVGLTGMAFAGLAAVFAQFTENARLARGLTAAAVGAFFVLRMAGDAATDSTQGSASPLVWLSPLGWAEEVRPYADERWWVLLPLIALAVVTITVAYALAGRRDIGAGFFAARPGPATGGPLLNGTVGLAWRLQRGALLGWAVGFVFVGAIFGSIADGADAIVGDNQNTREMFQRMGGQAGLRDNFLAAMVSMISLTCVVYAVGSVLRLRAEETDGRAEPLLTNAVSRLRWAGGHLVMAYLGTVVILAVNGLAMGIGFGRLRRPRQAGPRVLGAALAQTPAVWTVTSAALLIFGLLPKYSSAGWGLVGVAIAIGWLGDTLKAPQAVMDISPFSHLPKLPGGDITATPSSGCSP